MIINIAQISSICIPICVSVCVCMCMCTNTYLPEGTRILLPNIPTQYIYYQYRKNPPLPPPPHPASPEKKSWNEIVQ